MSTGDYERVPFNELQGIAPFDVPAYSNEYDDFVSFEAAYTFGVYTGLKWQCVEFARRWLLLRKSCIFQNVGSAADMWSEMSHIERVTDGKKFSVRTHPNGSVDKPSCEAFLLYPRSEETPYGHIAVISEVHDDFIRVVEQNYLFRSWPENYARQIPLVYRDGLYYLEDYYHVFGWMDIDETEKLEPLDQSNSWRILEKYRRPSPQGTIERFNLCEVYSDGDDSSSDSDLRLQKWPTKSHDHALAYCKIDEDFLVNLSSTSNELHRLLLSTAAHVIETDELLRDFQIPKVFWTPIRRSWANKIHSDLLDHLDFEFDGRTLKLAEYNADHTSSIVECAVLQERWIEQMKIECHLSVNFQLHRLLVRHWRLLQLSSCVHIVVGDQRDEMITALYMQMVLKEAEIESKICRVPHDFYWEETTIVDKDGDRVKVVWGSWRWSQIFQEYNDRCESDERPLREEHPRLSDILLDTDIRNLEPLWKSITTHRSMLNILSARLRDHPNLQCDSWMSSEETQCLPSIQWATDGDHDGHDDSAIDDDLDDVSSHHKAFTGKHQEDTSQTIVSWMIAGLFSGVGIRSSHGQIVDDNGTSTVCCVI